MKEKRNLEIQTTADGSTTIYLPNMDEHYHSVNGAIVESQHIYIGNGLLAHKGKELSLLEIGFGTGLNAIQTLITCENQKIKMHYTTYEKYPLDQEITNQLNFNLEEKYLEFYRQIHRAEWNRPIEITSQFTIQKIEADLTTEKISGNFDVVYFDAFAPDKQPDLWNETLFKNIYDQMNLGGILVTYCAKGAVRRLLKSIGFTTYRLPGPPGKREILQARKEVRNEM
ncbi:MAG: tRNA (5-methylaminomethyl-2-thiouridine)(34)-methyltransferase MnmD [Paludibacteraceae bacterium]|nr:tRNA (5-methylaminomethyl-2-thiouridine)(34)-methyltransferase MnmD [Paludibacteraceae bacterium]